jgi:hypothetical protein
MNLTKVDNQTLLDLEVEGGKKDKKQEIQVAAQEVIILHQKRESFQRLFLKSANCRLYLTLTDPFQFKGRGTSS